MTVLTGANSAYIDVKKAVLDHTNTTAAVISGVGEEATSHGHSSLTATAQKPKSSR